MRLVAITTALFACVIIGTNSFAYAQEWKTQSSYDPVKEQTLTAFSLDSLDGEASISIRCTDNTTFGDGHVGVYKDILIATSDFLDENTMSLNMRIDDGQPLGKSAVVTTDYKGMVIDDEEGMMSFYNGKLPDDQVDFRVFVPQLLSAKKILVELPVFESADKIYEFDSTGKDPTDVLKVCDLHPPLKQPKATRKRVRERHEKIGAVIQPEVSQ